MLLLIYCCKSKGPQNICTNCKILNCAAAPPVHCHSPKYVLLGDSQGTFGSAVSLLLDSPLYDINPSGTYDPRESFAALANKLKGVGVLVDILSYFLSALKKGKTGSDTVAVNAMCDKDLLQVESKQRCGKHFFITHSMIAYMINGWNLFKFMLNKSLIEMGGFSAL